MPTLVQKLNEGPLDIVGDVHGDIAALENLLRHLGYDASGHHAENRHLVFVGDLTDRGPDSVAVIQQVQSLIEAGQAQCVLGNHELNILLDEEKFDNGWYFGKRFLDSDGRQVKQRLVTEDLERNELLVFFQSLPLVLVRDDVRVVHACWQPEMVSMATEAIDTLTFYKQHRFNVNVGLALRSDLRDWQREQRHQNLNPVKVLTSGLEVKIKEPFEASGKIRYLDRFPWWHDYDDEAYCFFGHYSQPYGIARDSSRAICVDYGVARRWVPKSKGDDSPEKWRLASVQFPELQIVFDNGDSEPIRIESSS